MDCSRNQGVNMVYVVRLLIEEHVGRVGGGWGM